MPTIAYDRAPLLSRRGLLQSGALLGGGMALSALPFARAVAQAAQAGGLEASWPNLTAMIERYVRSKKIAGMISALGWGTAAPGYIARGREGFDDPDPDRPDSLFRAYSMTKPITGMAAMILIDEGKLKLDQPLADFAPEFARMKVAAYPRYNLNSWPAKAQITIRHLLTHTSGLGYAVVQTDRASEALRNKGVNPSLVTRTRYSKISDGPPTPGPDEFLRLAATVPLVAEPGTKWYYSMGLDVLGIIIGRIAGGGYEAFVQERILGPCGMTSSFFQVPQGALDRLTTNYGFFLGDPIAIDRPGNSIYQGPIPFAFGGSGLVTTPADYDRFLAMLVNKGWSGNRRVMSEQAIRMGTSNLLPSTVNLKGAWIEGFEFGAGGLVGTGKDKGMFGWTGAAGTIGFAHLDLGLRASLFVQYMPQGKLPVFDDFRKALDLDLPIARAHRT